MSANSKLCREVWAALERYPALRVQSVIVDSETYLWTCLVRVPWERFGRTAASHDDVARLASELATYEEQQREAARPVPAVAHVTGEVQLGLF